MRLDDERQSENVEDRRSQSRGGNVSMRQMAMLWPLIRMLLQTKFGWAIIAVGAAAYLFGFNPIALLQEGERHPVDKVKNEQEAVFIKKVLASTEDVWSEVLPEYGHRYRPPILVLYRGSTRSGCGYASAQMGPFYCPNDAKVYLDLGFYDELATHYNAPGDFAQAYVLAHEIGHHVQNLLGTLKQVQSLQKQAMQSGDRTAANHLQIPVELQADCYAGVWGHYARKHLEPGDIKEAINAAGRIGDDTLQKQTQGYVVPDSFTHGTSKQRMEWFMRGFKSGDLKECNTFQ